jgi:hypothetical protein
MTLMNRTSMPAARDRSLAAMHVVTGVVTAATVASVGAVTGVAAAATAEQQTAKAHAQAQAAAALGGEVLAREYRTVISETVIEAAAEGGVLTPPSTPKVPGKAASSSKPSAARAAAPRPAAPGPAAAQPAAPQQAAPAPAAPKPAAPKPAPPPPVTTTGS